MLIPDLTVARSCAGSTVMVKFASPRSRGLNYCDTVHFHFFSWFLSRSAICSSAT